MFTVKLFLICVEGSLLVSIESQAVLICVEGSLLVSIKSQAVSAQYSKEVLLVSKHQAVSDLCFKEIFLSLMLAIINLNMYLFELSSSFKY